MKNKEVKVHNKLKDLRKKRGLSQEEVADALGVSRQSVIALEQEKYMPSLPIAVSLCNLFGSAFEEIFEFEKEMDRIFDDHFNNEISLIHPVKSSHNEVVEGAFNRAKEAQMPRELEPWRPFREAVSLRDAMDRLFEDSVITPKAIGVMPKIDIKETKDAVVVRAELPGVDEEKINVEVMDNILTISGSRDEEKEEEKEGFYYKESHTGAFERSFTLPSEVMADKAQAEMKNGILKISVPKIEPKQAKKIAIKPKK